MGARSLGMKQEKLQRPIRRVQHELPTSVSSPPMPPTSSNIVAYSPIFISPSAISFDPFSPSPSPLPGAPAGAPVQHHSVPTAAIVGGGIAGVVALAATATIISAVAGKAGLSCCLLGPICKLLSGFTGKFIEPCTGRLKSLCNTLKKWNPASKRRISGDDEAGADHMDLYSALGGSPTTVTSNAESAAAAAPAHSLAQSPLRDVVKGHTEHLEISAHAFLATNVSDFAESQLKKQKEMMLQPLNQNIAKAQGYIKANANRITMSTAETISAVWKQPGLSMFEETIEVGGGKAENTIAKEIAEGKLGITSNREADEFEDAELKQQVCIVESDPSSHKHQVEEVGAPSSHKHETGGVIASGSNKMALVPTQYAGGNATSSQATGTTLVAMPTKAMTPVARRTMTSVSKGEWTPDNNDVMQKGKRKRPSNLGHVSFSCEMSAHRLRFFTSCRTGGTYGSPPASPLTTNHHNNHNNNSLNYNNYHDHSLNKASNNYYSNSHPTNYHAPLYNADSHFNLMHQQYHPSPSIVVQRDTQSPATLTHQYTPLEVIHNKSSDSKPSIHDYGGPLDGVL